VADLAQEVVQEAHRERIAGLAVDDARVRAAEARAGQAEAALHAAQAGLAQRAAALDDAQARADARELAADERNHLADARNQAADERDRAAASRCSRRPGRPNNGSRPRLRLGLPRDPCRAPSCWPCDRVVWAASLPCSGPLTRGQHAATAPPTATPRGRVLPALKRGASRKVVQVMSERQGRDIADYASTAPCLAAACSRALR